MYITFILRSSIADKCCWGCDATSFILPIIFLVQKREKIDGHSAVGYQNLYLKNVCSVFNAQHVYFCFFHRTDNAATMVLQLTDNVVVAGLACRLPESDNVDKFWSHLINKEDMVTEEDQCWMPGLHGLPKHSGKLKDIKHFDATFFGVHANQAHKMDPQLQIFIEITYEAFVDVGVDAQKIHNSRTGVFVGASRSQAGEVFSANVLKR